MRHLILLMILLLNSPSLSPTIRAQECVAPPDSQIEPGVTAEIVTALPISLYSDPANSFSTIGGLSPGTALIVAAGPECHEGVIWWRVILPEQTGWIRGVMDNLPTLQAIERLPYDVVLRPSPRPVEIHNLRFRYEDFLGAIAVARIEPAIVPQPNVPLEAAHPEYRRVRFVDYPLAAFSAELRVYPLDRGESYNPALRARDTLLPFLQTRPEIDLATTILPYMQPEGLQLFRAQVRYLDFENGAGMRYLTQVAPSAVPIENRRIVYTFQGLTEDGGYYVHITLPVHAALLDNPVEGATYPEGMDSPYGDGRYADYLLAMMRALDAESPRSFTPPLDVLDTLIESLEVEPIGNVLPPANFTCAGAPSLRLIIGGQARRIEGGGNWLRAEPYLQAAQIVEIPPGGVMAVTGEPVCEAGYVWWPVDYKGLTGWTVEGAGNNYWLEPVPQQ
jgi:hypothetical protein